MKHVFIFDASAAHHFYIPKEEYRDVLAYLMSLREQNNALFFIPSFCVAETLNSFAKIYYRLNQIEKSLYEEIRESFINAVHNRKIFYCYDLNRYHNLNAEEIFPLEHSINTEFSFVGDKKPTGTTIREREQDLGRIYEELKAQNVDIRKHYLSSFDILLISMARELRRFFGEKRTFIVTKDERIKTICEKGKLMKVIYLPASRLKDLQTRLNSV